MTQAHASPEPTKPLDEPGKLAKIIVPRTANDESQSVTLDNDATATLVLDAAAQDDCAAYLLTGEQVLVAGSDYVRGPKFRLYELGFLTNYDIGWYLAGANLSDIAAMGATPLGLLSVIRYPKDLDDGAFAEIVDGIRDACQTVNARNIGGDIGSAERIILSASAFGVVEPGRVLTRTNARPGQVVCITGPTGLAGAAMRLGNCNKADAVPEETFGRLLAKWQRVTPRVAHGRILAKSGYVGACLDTSDGLKGALETLATASDVGIRVSQRDIPTHPDVAAAAKVLDVDVLDIVFGDSVDFELVVTIDEDNVTELIDECRRLGLDLIPIGRVVDGNGVSIGTGNDRAAVAPLPGRAWRHEH